MTRKDNFMALLNKHGHKSLNSFCNDNNIGQANLSRRLNDESIKIELPLIFKIANILGEPIEILLEIFYPEEMKENRAAKK